MVKLRGRRSWGVLDLAAAVGVTAALVLAAPASAASASATLAPAARSGWPQFQGNASHTGDEPGETSLNRFNVGQLTTAWTQSYSGDDYVAPDPVVAGGAVYIAFGDEVRAYNAVTGAPLWTTTMPDSPYGAPAVADGLVVVAYDAPGRLGKCCTGYVAALNASTGAVVWTTNLHQQGLAVESPTTTAHRVYVTLDSNRVAAVGLRRGALLWESPALSTPACGLSTPSVAGAFVVVGVAGLGVTALNAATGSVAWTDTLGSGVCQLYEDSYMPAISGGTVYAGWTGGIAAITVDSGAIVWDNQSVAYVAYPLSVTPTEVISSPGSEIDGSVLTALSRADGSTLWTTTLNSGAPKMTATFGGLTWSTNGLYAAATRATSGDTYFYTPVSGAYTLSPPVVDDGRVYVSTRSELECLALPS